MELDLTPRELLTTTRTVRKRLDLERPVERDVVEAGLLAGLDLPVLDTTATEFTFSVSTPGALAEGDIGVHFPPSDPQWRGASSDRFLAFAADRVRQRGSPHFSRTWRLVERTTFLATRTGYLPCRRLTEPPAVKAANRVSASASTNVSKNHVTCARCHFVGDTSGIDWTVWSSGLSGAASRSVCERTSAYRSRIASAVQVLGGMVPRLDRDTDNAKGGTSTSVDVHTAGTASRTGAPVCARTSSIVTSGASSTSLRPSSVMSRTHRSVMIRCTTPLPV